MNSQIESEFAAIKRWNLKIKALIDWDESAAAARAKQAGNGPLAGWSIAVKDIIDVAGLPTRCNADFMPAEPASQNAAIVDALIKCGAFVTAKAVTTTFAYLDPGPTRNPWNPAHTPGGSSSGPAAAVACGMTRLALGTQTAGSINRPASFCGVVGFKPTFGRLPMSGIFPFSPTVDTVGFFAGSVSDIQEAFAAITDDPVAPPPTGPRRIGVLSDLLCEPPDTQMSAAVQTTADQLKQAGCEVKAVTLPQQLRGTYDDHLALMAAESARSHSQLFTRFGSHYPPNIRNLILQGHALGDTDLHQLRLQRKENSTLICRLFDSCDLLLTPSAPGPAPYGIDQTGHPRMNILWTHAHLPSLTLPASLSDDHLPLGVQLVGPAKTDQMLLAAGKRIEAILNFSHTCRR